MIPLQPAGLFALDRVRRDEQSMVRMERMLTALGRQTDEVVWIGEKNLDEALEYLLSLWPPGDVPESTPLSYTRPLVFTTMEMGTRYTEYTRIESAHEGGCPVERAP